MLDPNVVNRRNNLDSRSSRSNHSNRLALQEISPSHPVLVLGPPRGVNQLERSWRWSIRNQALVKREKTRQVLRPAPFVQGTDPRDDKLVVFGPLGHLLHRRRVLGREQPLFPQKLTATSIPALFALPTRLSSIVVPLFFAQGDVPQSGLFIPHNLDYPRLELHVLLDIVFFGDSREI